MHVASILRNWNSRSTIFEFGTSLIGALMIVDDKPTLTLTMTNHDCWKRRNGQRQVGAGIVSTENSQSRSHSLSDEVSAILPSILVLLQEKAQLEPNWQWARKRTTRTLRATPIRSIISQNPSDRNSKECSQSSHHRVQAKVSLKEPINKVPTKEHISRHKLKFLQTTDSIVYRNNETIRLQWQWSDQRCSPLPKEAKGNEMLVAANQKKTSPTTAVPLENNVSTAINTDGNRNGKDVIGWRVNGRCEHLCHIPTWY